MPESEDKPESQARAVAFERRLQELGLIPGRNLQIDYRWGMGEVEKARAATADLLKLTPSVLIAVASPATAAMQRTTRTIPIVFVAVSVPKAAIMATRWRTNSSASAGSRSRSGKNIQQLSDLTLLVFKHYRKWGVNL